MRRTKVSIITSVFNRCDTVAQALDSVFAQTYPELESIVVDGGSTDGTLAVLANYRSRLASLSSEPDNGIYDAMNKGINLATGEVIGTLNADDFYTTPDVLASVAAIFEDPAVMSCYGNLEYVRDTNTGYGSVSPSGFSVVRHWQSGPFNRDKFKWGWMPPHPTFFVRRSMYEKFGPFRLDMGSAADYELMLRFLFKHRITASYIPEVLVQMRAGGVSNSTLTNRLRANRMDRLAWSVNGLTPYPWTLLLKPLRKLPQFLRRF
jgi:glycosyltransferase